MPAVLGQFELSLRGRGGGERGDQAVLHHSCSGASHGHGCRKDSKERVVAADRGRHNSLPPDAVPDILRQVVGGGAGDRRASLGPAPTTARRSSSEVIKRMLYGSATKDDLKNRAAVAESLVRRHSVESEAEREGDTPSPPLPGVSTPRTKPSIRTLPRRTKSSSQTALPTTPSPQPKKNSYAFGSSTERFSPGEADSAGRTRASQDNLASSPHSSLQRTISDPRVAPSPGRAARQPQHKNSVQKAWLQFQADIEAALHRKPGAGSGTYKNLSDLLCSRMDQLEEVKEFARRLEDVRTDPILVSSYSWQLHSGARNSTLRESFVLKKV